MAIAEDAATVLEQFIHDGNAHRSHELIQTEANGLQSQICQQRLLISMKKRKLRTHRYKSCALR